MKIAATITCNDNNYYQVSSDDELMGHCFGGYGYSVAEAKEDFLRSIEEAKEMIVEDGFVVPPDAEHIKIEYRYNI